MEVLNTKGNWCSSMNVGGTHLQPPVIHYTPGCINYSQVIVPLSLGAVHTTTHFAEATMILLRLGLLFTQHEFSHFKNSNFWIQPRRCFCSIAAAALLWTVTTASSLSTTLAYILHCFECFGQLCVNPERVVTLSQHESPTAWLLHLPDQRCRVNGPLVHL